MGLMAEVKCGRCDRRYSSLKSRCPYCGARRNKNGKHTENESNALAKLLIGIVILLLLVVAVVVLILSSLKANKNPQGGKVSDKPGTTVQEPSKSGTNPGENITTVPGTTTPGTTEPGTTTQPGTTEPGTTTQPGTTEPGTTTTPPTTTGDPSKPSVSNLRITWQGYGKEDVTMELGEVLVFEADYDLSPEGADVEIKWTSSNTSVFEVLQTGQVTAVGSGTADLTVTVGDKVAICIIRVD